MRTFRFTIENTESWAIANCEIIIVATDTKQAKKLLTNEGYVIKNTSQLIELKNGVHLIQEALTQ